MRHESWACLQSVPLSIEETGTVFSLCRCGLQQWVGRVLGERWEGVTLYSGGGGTTTTASAVCLSNVQKGCTQCRLMELAVRILLGKSPNERQNRGKEVKRTEASLKKRENSPHKERKTDTHPAGWIYYVHVPLVTTVNSA